MLSLAAVERRSAPSADTWVVTLCAVAAMFTTASVRTGEWVMPGAPLVALILLSCTVLALRTLRPLLVLGCVVGVEVCMLVSLAVPEVLSLSTEGMGAYQPVPLGTMIATFTVASRAPRRVGWGAGLVAGGVLMLTGLVAHGQPTALTDLVVFYLVMNAAALGALRASRREARELRRLEQERDTETAVAEERLRIARELHDVLAHNLTLVNAQAGVAEYLIATRPEAAAQALRGITQHTAHAIDELRATIGLLRYDGRSGPVDGDVGDSLRPVPGIDALDEMLGSYEATGAPVEVTESGARRTLSQHADLAAYRIVQEALTNAAKHAPGMPVEVHLAWSDAGVRIRVVNRALTPGRRTTAPPGTGHGLIGMRERALAAGGALRVGEVADDRFEVVATLPAVLSTSSGAVLPSRSGGPETRTLPSPDPFDERSRP